jgi:hypothetical protein
MFILGVITMGQLMCIILLLFPFLALGAQGIRETLRFTSVS